MNICGKEDQNTIAFCKALQKTCSYADIFTHRDLSDPTLAYIHL